VADARKAPRVLHELVVQTELFVDALRIEFVVVVVMVNCGVKPGESAPCAPSRRRGDAEGMNVVTVWAHRAARREPGNDALAHFAGACSGEVTARMAHPGTLWA
jgi:hypothetical protein